MGKRALTDAAVKRFKPPKTGRIERFDGLLPGFGVRITSNGHKSWIVLGQVYNAKKNKMERARLTLGTTGEYSLAEAREMAQTYKDEIKSGRDPRLLKTREKAEAQRAQGNTFRSVAEAWLADTGKRGGAWLRSKRAIESQLERDVYPTLGTVPVTEIRRSDVRDLVRKIAVERPVAANRCLAAVRRTFSWWMSQDDEFEASPAVGIVPPGEEVARDRALTDGEIKTLWSVDAGYPYDPFTKLLLVTAQRLREVGGMRWPDVDLDEKLWVLSKEVTKSKRTHVVPLSALAVEILETLPRHKGDFVFTTTNGEHPISGFSKGKKRIDELLKKLSEQKPDDFPEVAPWRYHDLRRTAGTGMAKLGISKDHRGRVFNHAVEGVTDVNYNEYDYLDKKRHALDAWASKLDGIINPEDDDKVVALRG